MILSSLNQSELERSVHLLITNGPLPHVQEIIASVGYGPEGLQHLADLLHAWRADQTTRRMKLLAQKRATQHREDTRRQVGQIVSAFNRTTKAIFNNDESVLRFLGLRPSRSSNNGHSGNGATGVEGNGQATAPSRRSAESQSLAAYVARGRKLFAAAENLNEEHKQRLAEAGWSAERLAEAAAQVEALATADSKQEEAVATYNQQLSATKQSERALREYYKEARALIRVAIYEADLEKKEQFKELIGL